MVGMRKIDYKARVHPGIQCHRPGAVDKAKNLTVPTKGCPYVMGALQTYFK